MGACDVCADYLSGSWSSLALNGRLGWASLVLLSLPHRFRPPASSRERRLLLTLHQGFGDSSPLPPWWVGFCRLVVFPPGLLHLLSLTSSHGFLGGAGYLTTPVSTCPLQGGCSLCPLTRSGYLIMFYRNWLSYGSLLYICTLLGSLTCILWSIPASCPTLPFSCLRFGGYGDGLQV